ncbi:helix-turn-helix domain-containing protein [Marinoscillum furvescens]|uniref:AraC family transcriptional regulator n=1 Tax=Marinoscillum furvescens DSM 4134 TaxID=1122208 RepID=A0A3D9LGK1_MARFU|nr:response regulator transcription factor [Marinoscillum furvescens]REE05491.1 AraC family transcriptional regulator [Marinoscillum furvescens DSM 4134]
MAHLQRFSKIRDYHNFAHLPPPQHPLISLVDYSNVRHETTSKKLSLVHDYYTIGLKRNVPYKFYYGQQEYDFDEGIMTFVSPNQVISLQDNPNIGTDISCKPTGWLLFIHPDFMWNTPLAETIRSYNFFNYSTNEALFLSKKEERTMVDILKRIEQEYQTNIDKFSQKIIISQIELLLSYAERFYERQFITRNKPNHLLLNKVENVLSKFFSTNSFAASGLPSVQQVSDELNISPGYLSNMLKSLTGMNTQQHIHNRLVEKAKEQLSTTQLSVSEIAYKLGFEHPSSFNKLFKRKTEMSPSEFRRTFN